MQVFFCNFCVLFLFFSEKRKNYSFCCDINLLGMKRITARTPVLITLRYPVTEGMYKGDINVGWNRPLALDGEA